MVRIDGQKLVDARIRRNLSQEQLAKKARIDVRTLQGHEGNGIHGCKSGTLDSLAAALEVSTADLGPDEPPPENNSPRNNASSSPDTAAKEALCLRELIEVYFISKLAAGSKVDVQPLDVIHHKLTDLAKTTPRTNEVIQDFIRTDLEFHKNMLRLADAEWVIPVWEKVQGHWSKLFPVDRYQNPTTCDAVVQEHELIIDAIRKGDKRAACDRLRSHLQASLGRAAFQNI